MGNRTNDLRKHCDGARSLSRNSLVGFVWYCRGTNHRCSQNPKPSFQKCFDANKPFPDKVLSYFQKVEIHRFHRKSASNTFTFQKVKIHRFHRKRSVEYVGVGQIPESFTVIVGSLGIDGSRKGLPDNIVFRYLQQRGFLLFWSTGIQKGNNTGTVRTFLRNNVSLVVPHDLAFVKNKCQIEA